MDKDTGLSKDAGEKPKSKGARPKRPTAPDEAEVEIKPESSEESCAEKKPGSPAEAVGALLKKVEEQLGREQLKPTLADYIRLRQLYRELEDEEPREIKVTWVDKSTKPDTES